MSYEDHFAFLVHISKLRPKIKVTLKIHESLIFGGNFICWF